MAHALQIQHYTLDVKYILGTLFDTINQYDQYDLKAITAQHSCLTDFSYFVLKIDCPYEPDNQFKGACQMRVNVTKNQFMYSTGQTRLLLCQSLTRPSFLRYSSFFLN